MNMLIVTTRRDLSLSYMIDEAIQRLAHIDVRYYDDGDLLTEVAGKSYDTVYLRDPFNTGNYDVDRIKAILDEISKTQNRANFIDDARNFEDLIIEDKWLQCQLLKDYMPATSLLKSSQQLNVSLQIAKERISSRGRGIVFNPQDLDPSKEYIVQPILGIEREYRVYCVGGEVLSEVAVRTSKTAQQGVKVAGIKEAPEDVLKFAQRIQGDMPYIDFMGLDIAVTSQGPVLLEMNRSPQFKRYNELTNTNIFVKVVESII